MKNQKGFSKISIIFAVLVGLLIIVGGLILFKNFGEQIIPQNNQQSSQDEIADWKTYRNEEYGFEFKYPQDFIFGKDVDLMSPGYLESISIKPSYRSFDSFFVEVFKGIIPPANGTCLRKENVLFGNNLIVTERHCGDAGGGVERYYIPSKEKDIFLIIGLSSIEMMLPAKHVPEEDIKTFFESFKFIK